MGSLIKKKNKYPLKLEEWFRVPSTLMCFSYNFRDCQFASLEEIWAAALIYIKIEK